MNIRKHCHKIMRAAADEHGTAMLEFVLVAPVLSYMLIAVLFMQNHIDYAMDSSQRFRQMGWNNVLPAQAKNITDGKDTADGAFFTVPLKPALGIAVASGVADGNAGAIAAGLMVGTNFYSKYDLKTDNYKDNYEAKATFPNGGWGTVLGSIGTFFAAKIGTGTYKEVKGLNAGWEDRYPYAVEPWMRQYSEKWDPCKIPIIGLVMEYELYIMAEGKTPVPRVDTRDNRDIGAADLDTGRYSSVYPFDRFSETAPATLKLTKINGKSQVLKAIQ